MNTATAHRLTCLFSGRVQGVGFRYTVHNLALRYDVRGYVRNLPDGRVELVMEGPDHDTAALLEDVKQKMSGYIKTVDVHDGPTTGQYERFCIKH